MDDVLLEETAIVGLVVEREAGCPKTAPTLVPPKIGVNVCTGLLSDEVDDVDEAAGAAVVATAPKMGLNPEVSRGFV